MSSFSLQRSPSPLSLLAYQAEAEQQHQPMTLLSYRQQHEELPSTTATQLQLQNLAMMNNEDATTDANNPQHAIQQSHRWTMFFSEIDPRMDMLLSVTFVIPNNSGDFEQFLITSPPMIASFSMTQDDLQSPTQQVNLAIELGLMTTQEEIDRSTFRYRDVRRRVMEEMPGQLRLPAEHASWNHASHDP
jgi:hypothetical protein